MERSTEQFIENLYRKNYHRLYVRACSILGQSSEAEAAVQEAFLAACKKPDKFIRSESHIGWLKRAVENEALHILREQKYSAALFMSIEELSPGQEPAALEDSSFELVELCQRAISKEDFDFFIRISKHESTFQEEAERQGVRLATCYKRFERIRKRLQQALDDYYKK